MLREFPLIDIASIKNLSQEEQDIVSAIIVNRGKVKGRLRTNKPSEELFEGKAAYVWRMVAFNVSPSPAHWCMPMTAEFYLKEDDHDKRRLLVKELDDLVAKVIDSVPKEQWHGIQRWSKAFYG